MGDDERSERPPRHIPPSLLLGAVVTALAALPYLHTLGDPFLWHGHSWLENNEHLGLADLPAYWTAGPWVAAGVGAPETFGPLAYTAFVAQAVLGGGAAHPLVFRIGSLALHALTAGLLASLMARIGGRWPRWACALAGLWFAWAPLQADVVCMPWCQPLILAALMVVGGAHLLLSPRGGGRIVGGMIIGLSPLAHVSAWPLAAVAALGVWWARAPEERGGIRRSGAPVAALASLLSLGLGAAVVGALPGHPGDPGHSALSGLGLLAYAASQPAPSSLRPAPMGIDAAALAGVALLAALQVGAIRARAGGAGRLLGAGLTWYAAGALGAILHHMEPSVLPDRLAYLPTLGFAFILGAAALLLDGALKGSRRWLLPSGAVAVLGLLVYINVIEAPRFADDPTLFSRERLLWPGSKDTQRELGIAYAETGDTGMALALLEGATQAEPERPDVVLTLFRVYLQRGEQDKALQVLRAGIAASPDSPQLKKEAEFWLDGE